MKKLKRWDLDALEKGNWEKWLGAVRYRSEVECTQSTVVGAWGRKINILWNGQWKQFWRNSNA